MPLSEDQIQRYARHILLPEVGGVGQEKLLAAEVRVSGEPALVELAGAYLSAAGVRVDAHSGAGLHLGLWERSPDRDGPEEIGCTLSRVCVRAESGRVRVVGGACPRCVGEPSGPMPPETGAIAASLAASECLRLILGIGEPARAWEIREASVSRIPFPCCPAHGAQP